MVQASVNISRNPPLNDPKEIKKQFSSKVDLIINAGYLKGKPSRIINLMGRRPKILRK